MNLIYKVISVVVALVTAPLWMPLVVYCALCIDPMENVPDGKTEEK